MQEILDFAIENKASDIHIYPTLNNTNKIKFRIKGELSEHIKLNNDEIESVISLLKFNANIDIALNKTPQSGKFKYTFNDKIYYLRVSTLPLTEIMEGCVIRVFTDEIDDVNYSLLPEDIVKIDSLKKYTNGLIIFSGPTGSGKSTSMYKLAKDISNYNKQIISIEDPVEKNIDKIVQMQVNEKAGINYDNALKSILRCDPDVIMVGEVRDRVTAKYVITASYSGHLLLTTIHAENCIGVINRLLDLGISIEDLKQTLLCIISQRLVKTKNNERQLITEILDKEALYNYLHKDEVNFITMQEKFDNAYKEGIISYEEKEKWGY